LSESDIDLEILKLKMMADLKKKALSLKKGQSTEKRDYRSILMDRLTERAKEILSCAESQYPEETRKIIEVLGKAIESGDIKDTIDEYSLYDLFLNLGLNVRIPTGIYYVRKGEKKSLIDLFKE
jgi:DNA-binding TFAR19-related protein (PDSD5 family)